MCITMCAWLVCVATVCVENECNCPKCVGNLGGCLEPVQGWGARKELKVILCPGVLGSVLKMQWSAWGWGWGVGRANKQQENEGVEDRENVECV